MTLQSARAKGKEAGIASSAEHCGDSWLERAGHFVRFFFRVHPHTAHNIEEVRLWSYAHGLEVPASQRGWGNVTRAAKAAGVMVATGGNRPAASSHGNLKPLYRRA